MADFNTKLSVYQNRYVELMQKDLVEHGMEFDSYARECVIAAVGAIQQKLYEDSVDFDELTGSNLIFVLKKVASLKLNANASPSECYFSIRNKKITSTDMNGKKVTKYEKRLDFGIEGDGYDSIAKRFGTDIETIYPCWQVREDDVYIPSKRKGLEITPPEWEQCGKGKVVRVVYPVKYRNGLVDYLVSERADTVKNLYAHIKNNMQKETFGICENSYTASATQKAQIDAKKKEILRKVEELEDIDAILDCEELSPYISPSWKDFSSREAMIVRKMRNNVMRKIPKTWNNPYQATQYQVLETDYQEVQEEIEENANKEVLTIEQNEEEMPVFQQTEAKEPVGAGF